MYEFTVMAAQSRSVKGDLKKNIDEKCNLCPRLYPYKKLMAQQWTCHKRLHVFAKPVNQDYVLGVRKMHDYKYSLNKKCSCTQKEYPILGNCVLCVQNHVEKGNHLPECMQGMIRSNIISLANMVEFECNENRPHGNFWETYDKENLIKTSIERHEINPIKK